jgi:hypothetical protein
MDIDGEHSYKLVLIGDVDRAIGTILNKGSVVVFPKSLTTKNTPKIYVVHHEKKIYSVGYAGQAIATRLRYGLNPKSAKGYAGYKWKDQAEVTITIFTFSTADLELNYTLKRHFVEAVEAEIVYGIRIITGRWPEYQNEIHFNNGHAKEVKNCAAEIISKIFKPISNFK